MLNPTRYALRGIDEMDTPALTYYPDIIMDNTQRTIDRAGGAARLWPHVKSHKMRDIILMQMSLGIERFKCATIAEAQMVADCGAGHIMLAYPIVGPMIGRFLSLVKAYPHSAFYAIGDDGAQLARLGEEATRTGQAIQAFLDVNLGMDRTGVPLADAEARYAAFSGIAGIKMVGLHCYDGHIHHPKLKERAALAEGGMERALSIRRSLQRSGFACESIVAGGTGTFPVHAAREGVFLSPGTVFLGDGMCIRDASELEIIPAAGVWTRVISHPAKGLFTLDLGVKGISTDQGEQRGILVGLENARPLFQSEEHWVWQMPAGEEAPAIGSCFFVVPMHICPTTMLYPYAHVVAEGVLVGRWQVTARDRRIGL